MTSCGVNPIMDIPQILANPWKFSIHLPGALYPLLSPALRDSSGKLFAFYHIHGLMRIASSRSISYLFSVTFRVRERLGLARSPKVENPHSVARLRCAAMSENWEFERSYPRRAARMWAATLNRAANSPSAGVAAGLSRHRSWRTIVQWRGKPAATTSSAFSVQWRGKPAATFPSTRQAPRNWGTRSSSASVESLGTEHPGARI